jgi:U3 small nucleolar RNA-associated protein MPP10
MNGTSTSATSFLDTLADSPQSLVYPSAEIHAAALRLAKFYLDPVAEAVHTAQITRRDEVRKTFNRKRKAGEFLNEEELNQAERERKGEDVLKLQSLAVDGFEPKQVWAQAGKIAHAVEIEIEEVIKQVGKKLNGVQNGKASQKGALSDGEDSQSTDEGDENELDPDEMEMEQDEDDGLDDELGSEMEDLDLEDVEDEDSTNEESEEQFIPDKFGLNDGFFSIEDFNRRTQALENLDARGEPDAPSDEEDVDWDVDPATLSLGTVTENQKHEADSGSDEDEDDDDDGPTFGNMDLNAPEGASDDEMDDEELEEDDNERPDNLMYTDFFEPPSQRKGDKRNGKSDTKRSKRPVHNEEPAAEDLEAEILKRASALQRELYSEDEDEEEPESDDDQPLIPVNASTHEKRQAALVAQIRELEAENVAKRSWTLMGEARGSDRPVDAVLGENLDFERTGKPLPIVTKETSEEIEELIRRRILAGEFDEVRRRRPEDVYSALKPRKSGLLDEPIDGPRKRGLADIYEEEHLRRTDSAYVDETSEKRSKEHAEIEALWKDISVKLDSLSSWNYKPKPAEMSVSVRTDAPAMSLEDARPSGTIGEVGSHNQLAPQEVYTPGDIKENGKVITKGGTLLNKAELSRDQKKRMRQREKERARNASEQKAQKPSNAKDKQSAMVADLKKGGVKIIGKKGELQDVDGNQVKDTVRQAGSSLRL